MADVNWQKVREIFDAALLVEPAQRRKFVRRQCEGQTGLCAEVESLLESFDGAENFLEKPAIAEVAGQLLRSEAQFSNGELLNHYEIIELIGEGGMGEVYLAQDTKLGEYTIRAGDPVSAYRENLFERARRLAVRHSTPILLVLAYLLMRLTFIAVFGR